MRKDKYFSKGKDKYFSRGKDKYFSKGRMWFRDGFGTV